MHVLNLKKKLFIRNNRQFRRMHLTWLVPVYEIYIKMEAEQDNLTIFISTGELASIKQPTSIS